MLERGIGILQVAQRDPAGEELAFDGLLALGEAMGAGDLVGGLARRLVVIDADRAARHDAALDPPGFGIAHLGGLARHLEQDGARLRLVLVLPVVARERIFHAERLAHGGGKAAYCLSAPASPRISFCATAAAFWYSEGRRLAARIAALVSCA